MVQTLLALAIVLAASGWLGWRVLRPALARVGVVERKGGGCACGDEGGGCSGDKVVG